MHSSQFIEREVMRLATYYDASDVCCVIQTWGESTFNDSESESDSGRLFDSESESDSSQFGYDSESNSDSSNISISDSESDSNFQLLI